MPNIHAIRQRSEQLKAEVAAKIRDLEEDRITIKQFEGFFARAEAENEDLARQMKAYQHRGPEVCVEGRRPVHEYARRSRASPDD